MNNPPDFIRHFWRTVWRWIIRCTAAPSPQKKSEKGCLWGRGTTVHGLVSDGQSISSSSVKTANNKMPVSTVLNDSEGLYRTTVCRCLLCRPHYSARQMRFGSRVRGVFFSQILHRNTLTEIAWEDDVQGLGMAMSTVASEKNRELLFPATCFTNSGISACCFTSISRARPPENLKY